MRPTLVLAPALALALALVPLSAARAGDQELQPGTTVAFASRQEAAKLLSVKDAFVEALSPFDRAARLKTDREVGEKEYLEFVAAQALDWTDDEKARIAAIVDDLRPKLAPLGLALPAVVRLVKTTGLEEGSAAYCRGAAIVLPKTLVEKKRALAGVLPHELFHVFSSHNAKLRPALYGVLGFTPCAPVKLPGTLAKKRITNPDAPGLDFAIQVKRGESKVPAVPVLVSRSERYDTRRGGEFFEYLELRLLVLEKKGEALEPALDAAGEPVLLALADAPDYLEQMGKNTGYTIHPEEVLADNFVLLLQGKKDVPSPAILEGLRKVLSDARAK